MSATTQTNRGLEDILAGSSSITYIDGKNGILAHRGIDIHELADFASFEEVTYLLWHGKLPTRSQLAEFSLLLARERKLDAQIISLLRQCPRHALPMDVLRTMVSSLSFFDPEEKVNTKQANYNKAMRLFSQIAMIVTAYDRIRKGLPLIEPDRTLTHAGNFLLMLNGERPSETAIRALDISLILSADHEWNASTFAARVTAATLSDMHSAITSAIGTLKGPLHGGANEQVFKILRTERTRWNISRACSLRRRKFRASGIACIPRKIRGLRICGGCRATWDIRADRRSGSNTRRQSRTSSTPIRSSTPMWISIRPRHITLWELT